MNQTLVVVPTYNERENLPPLCESCWPCRSRSMCWWSMTILLMARDGWPKNWPPDTSSSTCFIAAKRMALGHAYLRRVQMGAGTGIRVRVRIGWRYVA